MGRFADSLRTLSAASEDSPGSLALDVIRALISCSSGASNELLDELLDAAKITVPTLNTDANLSFHINILRTTALLLEQSGTSLDRLEEVVKRCCLPLLAPTVPSSVQAKVSATCANVIASHSAWHFAISLLLPSSLEALGIPHLATYQYRLKGAAQLDTAMNQQSEITTSADAIATDREATSCDSVEESGKFGSLGSIAPGAACHLLGCLLKVAKNFILDALELEEGPSGRHSSSEVVHCGAKLGIDSTPDKASRGGKRLGVSALDFLEEVVDRALLPSLGLLERPVDELIRRQVMQFLMPPTFEAAVVIGWTGEGASRGSEEEVRSAIGASIWQCCQSLMKMGGTKHQEAYTIFSSFARLLLPAVTVWGLGGVPEAGGTGLPFDLRTHEEFWSFVKSGLAGNDSLTRKRALHILRCSLPEPEDETFASFNREKGFEKRKQSVNECESWAEQGTQCLNGRSKPAMDSTQARTWHARWEAFILLLETLDEYALHLAEAGWQPQMDILVPPMVSVPPAGSVPSTGWAAGDSSKPGSHMLNLDFSWMAVLWARGFRHTNPQVRRLVLRSFLQCSWDYRPYASNVPEHFVCGPLLLALDDPAHHRDFGLEGNYTTATTRAAVSFFKAYSRELPPDRKLRFLQQLAAHLAFAMSPCRSGLMAGAMCLETAAVTSAETDSLHSQSVEILAESTYWNSAANGQINVAKESPSDDLPSSEHANLLNSLGGLVEHTKRHFNTSYRATGALHATFLDWLRLAVSQRQLSARSLPTATDHLPAGWLTSGLEEMLDGFLGARNNQGSHVSDEELEAWGAEARRWAKMLRLGGLAGANVEMLLEEVATRVAGLLRSMEVPSSAAQKALLLLRSLLEECRMQMDLKGCSSSQRNYEAQHEQAASADTLSTAASMELSVSAYGNRGQLFGNGEVEELQQSFLEKVTVLLNRHLILLVTYARQQAQIFSMDVRAFLGLPLPASITGRLGGGSQRRLPAAVTSPVVSAVLAVQVTAEAAQWLLDAAPFLPSENSAAARTFLWDSIWDVVGPSSFLASTFATEIEAELALAALQALSPVCKTFAAFFPLTTWRGVEWKSSNSNEGIKVEEMMDQFAQALLRAVEAVLGGGALARSRRAILEYYQWCCLDSLISPTEHAAPKLEKEIIPQTELMKPAVSDGTVKIILKNAIESLETVGESFMIPLLRCIRSLIACGAVHLAGLDVTGGEVQVMRAVVRAGWSAMVDANSGKVAPIAAFLSSMLHPAVFGDPRMHADRSEGEESEGPLKWILGQLIDHGTRSPRIMRLTALHLSGLLLRHPEIAGLYIAQLKVFALHGTDVVDEEVIAEIGASEADYLMLARSADPELVEIFSNSEMYARVSIAILMFQLSIEYVKNCESEEPLKRGRAQSARDCGQAFLSALLRASVTEAGLSKELYKKKSAVHRKKVRAWQMLVILSRFLERHMLEEVILSLDTAIERNNMPSVRQFLEIFAVQVYLRFPHLVEEHLVPMLQQHNMKAQAQASYVLIAAHVILHVAPSLRAGVASLVVPAALPSLTTHHHSLRSFAQVLLFRVLSQFTSHEVMPNSLIDSRCLQSIREFLEKNEQCVKLRVAVESYLDAFDPVSVTTPRGIFVMHDDGEEDQSKTMDDVIECVPIAVYDHVAFFLKVVREELRESVAADMAHLHLEAAEERDKREKWSSKDSIPSNHGDKSAKSSSVFEESPNSSLNWDFQRKFLSTEARANLPAEDELDEELLLGAAESRMNHVAAIRGNRQNLIVVASLINRIPNLAGLARTCEVFKAASLVVADASVADDRQFQLISVTAEQWIPLIEVPESGLSSFLQRRQQDGYTLLGLEQTANSIPIHSYDFPTKTVLVLGREKEGIPVPILHMLDACVEIPQLGVIRSLNVHVSGAIAAWEYTKQHGGKH